MIDPKLQAAAEQGIEYVCEVFVPNLRRIFDKAKETGFTDDQAMSFCLKYIETAMWNGPQTMYP